MKYFLTVVFLLCVSISFGQDKPAVVPNKNVEVNSDGNQNQQDDSIHAVQGIDKKPEFPGGLAKFYEYIGATYNIPASLKDGSGKIFVVFVVEKDGSLTDIKVLRDIGHGTGAEAVRILKGSPKWIPGEQNGRLVRVQFTLPIEIKAPTYRK